MRVLVTVVVALLCVAGGISVGFSAENAIDLDNPGALEALRKDNPTHYETIRDILAGLSEIRIGSDIPSFLQRKFKATNVSCPRVADAWLILASNPPKLPVSFTLDRTQYRKLITLTKFREPKCELLLLTEPLSTK